MGLLGGEMKIPKNLRIAGQNFEVIQTDDSTLLDGDNFGFWRAHDNKIWIKKTVPQCQKEETLLHEAGEVLLVSILKIGEKDFSHKDWSRFCQCFYDLLERNGLLDHEKHSSNR